MFGAIAHTPHILALTYPVNQPGNRVYEEMEEARLAEIEEALIQHRVSEKHYRALAAILQKRPEDLMARYLLGRCYLSDGLVDTAQEQFRRCDDARTNAPEATLRLFHRHFFRNDLQEAYALLPFVSRRFPEDPSVRLVRAICEEENCSSGGTKAITQRYDALLASPAPPLGAATRLAMQRLKQHEFAEAIKLADADLLKSAQYIPAIVVKATALVHQKRAASSLKLLQTALIRAPFDSSLVQAALQAADAVGSRQDALRYALRNLALASTPGEAASAKELAGNIILKSSPRQTNQAVKEVSLAADKGAFALAFHLDLADLFSTLRRPEQSMEQLQICLRIDPAQEAAIFRLARLTERYQHNYEEALRLYELVSRSKPLLFSNNMSIARLRARLSNKHRDIAWRVKMAWQRAAR